MVLNMCMFATRVDYDNAVRKQLAANKQQAVPSSNKERQDIDENQVLEYNCCSQIETA